MQLWASFIPGKQVFPQTFPQTIPASLPPKLECGVWRVGCGVWGVGKFSAIIPIRCWEPESLNRKRGFGFRVGTIQGLSPIGMKKPSESTPPHPKDRPNDRLPCELLGGCDRSTDVEFEPYRDLVLCVELFYRNYTAPLYGLYRQTLRQFLANLSPCAGA